MLRNNYWVRSGTYVILQRFSIFLFGFGGYFFMVRYFPKEEFGVWVLFVAITSIVEMSRSAFIQNAFVKMFNEPGTDQPALVTASLFLNFVSTLFFILVMILLNPLLNMFWHTHDMTQLILWYCFTSLVLVPFTQLNYVEQANHSFRGVFWSAVVRQGFFFGVVVYVFFFVPGLPLSFYAILQSICALAGLAISWILSGKFMPAQLKFDWPLISRLFKFGKYILGTGITSSIGKSTDQIILGSISHSTVALYNSAIRVMNFIEIPSLSISNIVYPKIAQMAMVEGKLGARDLYQKSVASIVGVILPLILFIFLFAQFVLLVTAGPAYVEAKTILRLLVVSAIFIPFNIQVGSAFEVIGKPQVSFYINLTGNLVNLVLNLVLVPRYGAMGAAWSLVASTTSTFAICQILLRREIGVSITKVVEELLAFYRRAPKEIAKFVGRKK